MKKQSKVVASLLCMFIALFTLSACTPTRYDRSQESEQIQKARPIMDAYLKGRYGDYSLDDLVLLSGNKVGQSIYSGYYATTLVSGRWEKDDVRHIIIVDTKSGDVFTDELSAAFNEYVKEVATPYLRDAGFESDFLVRSALLCYNIACPGMVVDGRPGQIVDVEAQIEGVFPVCLSEETIADYGKTPYNQVMFNNITLIYCGEADHSFPIEAMEALLQSDEVYEGMNLNVYNVTAKDFAAVALRDDFDYSTPYQEKYYYSANGNEGFLEGSYYTPE